MNIPNRPVWSGIAVALILVFVPCFGASVFPGAISEAAGDSRSKSIVGASINTFGDGPSNGVTHVMEFVASAGPPASPEPGKLVSPYSDPGPRLNPREIAVCVGDSVEFKNNWTGQVNAFSYSSAFRLDTGRFRPGESRTVGPFQQEGIVRVYDELHRHIKAFIIVVDCSSKSIQEGEQQGRELLKKEGESLGEESSGQGNSDKQKAPQDNRNSSTETGRGLHTTIFDTLYGQVIVYLPDDMAAGDTISGTVETKAKGRTEEEKAKNQPKLDQSWIVLDAAKLPAKQHSLVWNVPAEETKSAVPYLARIFEADSGKELATAVITPAPKIMGGEVPEPPNRRTIPPFVWLPIWQQGKPIEILGPFDGDSSNTALNWTAIRSPVQDFEKHTENVSGGFGLIAESPRKAVFIAPVNVVGPIEIHLKESSVETKGQARIVGVKLTAPKTSLLKGESTTVSITVLGLQGIKEPVPLGLVKGGVVSMQGGDVQTISITPDEVKKDGSYSTTRTITGQQRGAFSVNATVIAKTSERGDPWASVSASKVLPNGVGLTPKGGGGLTMTNLYLEGKNFPDDISAKLEPDGGTAVVFVQRVDAENLIVTLAVSPEARPGAKAIILFDPKNQKQAISTGLALNFYKSLTPEEDKAIEGKVLRNKWNKYNQFKNSNPKMAALWMAVLMQELHMLPPKLNRGDKENFDPSRWQQFVAGLEAALTAGAEDVAKTPVPTDTLNALLELYNTLKAFFGDTGTYGGRHGLDRQLRNRGFSDEEIQEIGDKIEDIYKGLGKRLGK